ncbi:MAG: RNA pseudouridine synthase [Desulfobulbaceae bacterium]|nr:MAG: RNA pseudouridine synthase [Desulfobulbaceae bacterium]
MDIIYLDNHLLVVNKPAGQLVQGDHTGRPTLLDEAKAWLKQEYNKPGNVYLGLVHRLDRPVSGVVVLARTSKAASRLSRQLRSHTPRKTYWARVEGKTPQAATWTDYLVRHHFFAAIGKAHEGKEARLSFRRLDYHDNISLVEIDLETGRYHQIRAQFSHHGHAIVGDRKYGSRHTLPPDIIALHAREMVLTHPTRGEEMHFVAEPAAGWLLL